MDEIFHKTTGPFDVVKIAKELPHRFDKHGELLIDYADTEAARETERRRSSVTGAMPGRGGMFAQEDKDGREHHEKTDGTNV
jgi:hypothetical protein